MKSVVYHVYKEMYIKIIDEQSSPANIRKEIWLRTTRDARERVWNQIEEKFSIQIEGYFEDNINAYGTITLGG